MRPPRRTDRRRRTSRLHDGPHRRSCGSSPSSRSATAIPTTCSRSSRRSTSPSSGVDRSRPADASKGYKVLIAAIDVRHQRIGRSAPFIPLMSSVVNRRSAPIGAAPHRPVGNVGGVSTSDLGATWTDVGSPILVVPVGSCEQHGPHLPLHTDTVIATALAHALVGAPRRLRRRPAAGDHRQRRAPGLRRHAVDRQRGDGRRRRSSWCARPIGRMGVVFVNGHGGNADGDARAADTLGAGRRGRCSCGGRACAGGDPHAGHVETSLMLALAPDEVRLDRAVAGPVPAIAELVRHGVLPVSASGVLGDPTAASAERGQAAARRARRSARRRRRPVDRMTSDRGTPAVGTRRYRLDSSVQRFGRSIVGGSPLKLFRVTDAGAAVVDRIAGRRACRRVGAGDRARRGGRDPPGTRHARRSPPPTSRSWCRHCGVPRARARREQCSSTTVRRCRCRVRRSGSRAQPRTGRGAQRRSRAA